MHHTLINLAEIHYDFGLIGHDEYRERIRVALWLADAHPGSEFDPRTDSDKETQENNEYEFEHNDKQGTVITRTDPTQKDNDNWIELVCFGTWVFTKKNRAKDSHPAIIKYPIKSIYYIALILLGIFYPFDLIDLFIRRGNTSATPSPHIPLPRPRRREKRNRASS